MSWQANAAVWSVKFTDQPAVDGIRYGCGRHVLKLVALAIADRCDRDGYDAHPGIRTIAARCDITMDTARIALAHLERLGVIRRTADGDGRRADVYALGLIHSARVDPRANEDAHPRAPRGSDPRAARGSDPRTTTYVPCIPADGVSGDAPDEPWTRPAAFDPRQVWQTARDTARREATG